MVSSIYQWRHQTDVKVAVDPKALADLRRRQSMPDTRDNTGRLLGDPPPGRSALDQRQERDMRAQNALLGDSGGPLDGQDGEGS